MGGAPEEGVEARVALRVAPAPNPAVPPTDDELHTIANVDTTLPLNALVADVHAALLSLARSDDIGDALSDTLSLLPLAQECTLMLAGSRRYLSAESLLALGRPPAAREILSSLRHVE